MSERLLKVLPLGVFGSLIAVLTAGFTPAQEPIPLFPPGGPVPIPRGEPAPEPIPLPLPGQPGHPAAPAQPDANANDGVEVLAKGPVHEGFAATAEAPAASPVVAKQPPEPIEELPPDQKPAGDNVQWIPGYWHWDEEVSKHIWISGFWRQPPPGRVWVPGAWREAKGGWQWVSGFWQGVQAPATQPEQHTQPQIEYLPQQPPESIESGPMVPAPGEGYFYAPGTWVWRNKYVWRPGVWVEHRANWLWVPARYHWTPAGYVFCDGYWDYPLATRGVLFAPVAFVRPIPPAFVYTPAYVVSEPCMVGALFVRRGYGNYYFGDYFDRGYGALGYSAWCGTVNRGGFNIGFGVGRNWGYDPLWSYYSTTFRDAPTWHRGVGDLYGGRYRGDVARPPATLVQQNTVINNITRVNVTNVTNNIRVVNGSATVGTRDVSNVAMVAPLRVAPDLQRTRFEGVSADGRRNESVAARQLRDVGAQRTRLETAAVTQPQAPVAPTGPGQPTVAAAAQPKSIRLDVPKAAVARAQVSDERKAPPPNPVRPAVSGPKIDPPRVEPKPPGQPFVQPGSAQPKIEPKFPVANPPIGPAPKAEPPRANANPAPVVSPKIDPPRVNAPQVVAPKVEPPRANPNPVPNVAPKAEPPRVNVPQPANPAQIVAPKVEPRPNPQLPLVAPKVEPPRVNPQPVVPKADPPRVNVAPPVPVIPPKVNPPQPAPVVNPPRPNPQPIVAPAVPAPKVNPPAPIVAPKINPLPPPAPVVAPVAPKANAAPVPPPAKVNPAPAPPQPAPKPPVPVPAPAPKAPAPPVPPAPKPAVVPPAVVPPAPNVPPVPKPAPKPGPAPQPPKKR